MTTKNKAIYPYLLTKIEKNMLVKFIATDSSEDFEEMINDEIGIEGRKFRDIKIMPSEDGFYCLIIFE